MKDALRTITKKPKKTLNIRQLINEYNKLKKIWQI